MKKSAPKTTPSLLMIAAFILPILYWAYLLAVAQTEVVWDSLDYEALGKMISEQGWVEFFKNGPNREPLYPFLISLCMQLANAVQGSYLKILDIIQFGCLLLTQIFTFKLLQKLKIHPWITSLTVLYIGISPALVNFALSVYSEILILPLIPLLILVCHSSFDNLKSCTSSRIVIKSVLIGTLLMLLTLIKGIFELISPLFLFSTLLLLPQIWKNQKIRKHYLIWFITSLVTFTALIIGYKSINKYYNGVFTITSRGPWALYGFAARRTETLTNQHWLAAAASIPGERACTKILNIDHCTYWAVSTSDSLGMTKLRDLQDQGLTGEILDKKLLALSFERIKLRPGQYSTLTFMEGFKIFFWESTRMAFVVYPRWLEIIFFEWTALNYGLRVFWAFISIIGFVVACIYGWPNQKGKASSLIFFALTLLITYTAAYSIFWINTRYALPMIPVMLILSAWAINRYVKW